MEEPGIKDLEAKKRVKYSHFYFNSRSLIHFLHSK